MSKITQSAKGKDCTIRIPGVCNGNPETVVHCHLNGAGMGTKHPDLFGARGCSACHDAVDLRVKTQYTYDELRLMHLDGMVRTQVQLMDEGLIKT